MTPDPQTTPPACPFKVGDRIQMRDSNVSKDILTITAIDDTGASYSGARPLSIPRMGIQGDGTGKIFPSAYHYYELAPPPVPVASAEPMYSHEETERLLQEAARCPHDVTIPTWDTVGLFAAQLARADARVAWLEAEQGKKWEAYKAAAFLN